MKERELFLAALEIEDPAARLAHLKVECADDAALLARIESLLTSHEGQSQFLNTPVVEQIADAPDAGSAATLLYGSGSTQDEEPDATEISFHGLDAMTENQDDEIPLGYLQPSSKPGSLGRLGHYEIHEVLGRGAFGTVLKAFDEKLHRVVAIKVLAPEIAATSPARKRFLREAQASAAIRHEHVVSIYAVEESPIPYLVMEYIPGLTLQQRLDERGPLDVPTVLRLGRQIAEGLAGAHAQDLIHRDIKPGNILLETSVHDRVKITDFGLARAADDASLTQSGTIAGTPMYMAPEQALGHKLDQRADLFSLGSVLYQMVSGRPPFRANGTLAVLKRVTEDTPRPISEIIPETPAWLCAIITKLHAKNPDERYQTAQEIADVLANCESQLKTHSGLKDFSLIPRAKAQPAGWWRWMAVAALVLPLLAFGLYAFTRPAAHPTVAGNGIKTSTLDPIKPDSELLPDQVTQQGIPASDGWVQLFNGQDLTGWKNDDDHWTIENGMLVTRLPKGAVKTSGFLQTVRKDYRDFHIRAEVKINEGGDSGLFVRFGEQGDVSLQAQITTDPGSVGSLLRHAATIVPGSHSVLADTWFTLEVIAQGPRVAVFVDGHEAATWFDPTGGTQAGPIGFESGFPGTEFFVRKVEIKSPSNATPVDFNGTWASDWGDVTFTQDLFSREAWPLMGGTYNKGHIAGTINLQTRVFTGTFQEKAGSTGRIRLTLSPSGASISGRYYHANLNETAGWNPERAPMVWNMTRRGAVPKSDSQQLAKNEWVQLFNGKDLTGWKFHPDHTGDWNVKDGILRGSKRQSHLFSERGDYGNFHLRAEVKINLGGDSGLLFRAPLELRRGRSPSEFGVAGCYEAELQHNRIHSRPTGSISEAAGDAPPTILGLVLDTSLTQPDEWFTYEVIAENNHFRTKINGNEAADCTDPLDRHQTGHIALQVWHPNTLVQFRKIEIKELPASSQLIQEPKTPISTDRFALAFDGEKSVVRIPSLRISEDHALTVETWAVLEQPAVLVQPVHQTGARDLIGNPSSAGFVLNVSVGYGGDGKKLAFMIRLKNPDTYAVAREKQPVPRNQLIHLAGVYDGSAEIRFYVNGQLQSRAPAQDIKPSTRQLTLGNNNEGTSGFLGRMNAVRISKVARYDADFTPANRWEADPDTLALYHFDEGEGTVLKDSSGNGHDGKIVGATWVKADGSSHGRLPAVPSEPLPPTFKNSLGMEFVIVPKGKSWLGGGKDKLGDKEVEIPADFYLGKYEVTQEEWEQVMGQNPSKFSRTGGSNDAVKDIPDADLKRFPVENVSWDQCQMFVEKLNKLEKQTGWVYRLPTLLEWEHACRGAGGRPALEYGFNFYFDQPTNTLLPDQANFKFGEKVLNRTCTVGSYKPNRLGLYDMHGNVWEWCQDERIDNEVSRRLPMGFSWDDARPAGAGFRRTGQLPSHRHNTIGLRLARVPSAVVSPEVKTPPPTVGPFTDADVKRIAALPAAEQVEEVRKELLRRNPGFDGTMTHKIENDVVTELRVVTDQVTDIAPIRVFKALRTLDLSGTFVNFKGYAPLADLSPLTGMNLVGLTMLNLNWTQVGDAGLAHFKDCKKLTRLDIARTKVTDLSLLKEMPLKELDCNFRPERDGEILRSIKTLEKINGKPAAEFWERYDKGEFAAAPFTDADVKRIAALPASEQVAEVRKELMKRNPGFDGTLKPTIENDVVTELSLNSDEIIDIAPVRALAGLIYLDCRGTYPNKGKLSDLSPLKGIKLSRLDCSSTQIADLTPLAGLPLTYLHFNHNPVSDLTPLKGMPLLELGLAETKVSDLSPLKGMKLKSLGAQLLPVTDLSPLEGMPLTGLDLYHTIGVTNLEPLKSMPLEGLNLQDVPVSDLSPLAGMTTLRTLLLEGNKVSDLTPLAGLKLTDLILRDKHVSDLSPLKGMPLARLEIYGTGVSDLRPLQDMPLQEIRLNPKNITQGLEILRDIKSLKTIGIDGDKVWPAAEFWARYDKGEFN